MVEQKPADITDHDWEKTPPNVRMLLTQSFERIKKLDASLKQITSGEPSPDIMPAIGDDGATVAMPLDDILPAGDDEGATFFMRDTPSTDDDGTTVAMLPDDTLPDDDGATFFMRDTTPTDDDGATVAMLADDISPADDDGATFLMRDTLSANDDGATVAMDDTSPTDDDGATMAMSPDDTLPDDEGVTVAMSPDDTLPDDDGATVILPDDGATTYMPDVAPTTDEGATTHMPDARTTAKRAVMPKKPSQRPTVMSKKAPEDISDKNIVLQERYHLQKILGKGGFGAAYLAIDLNLGHRECVVKQMLNPKGISAKELEMNQASFEREASLLAQLNTPGHPNIPDIFDYFSDKSGSYLVMKYIEGQSLKGLIKGDKEKIPWQEAVRYIVDVCGALSYMHSKGEEPVMHRDIKPDNIVLGDDGRVWLIDFGLAHAQPVEGSGELTASAQASGSVGYTPFEQWLGETVPTSDVYATGVTLHQMVTNASPLEVYRDESGTITVNIEKLQTLHGQIDPIRTFDKKLPRELEEIISNAIIPDPEQRLTALQFQQQLEILVSGDTDAALFTFKNGVSAYTIAELVDLCEQNRTEAQGYLYRGDFARWFTMINRNDLAEAANKAVNHGKDALERFIKLIMPNVFWRRLGRAGLKTVKVGLQLVVVLILAAILTIAATSLIGQWILQRTIAGYNWDYYALDLDKDNVFDETYLNENAHAATQLFLEDIQVSPRGPGQIIVDANLGNIIYLNVPITLGMGDKNPRVTLTEINDTPLYIIGNYLTLGINSGIDEALQSAPIKITEVKVDDEAVIVNVEKSDQVAYAPPTPAPDIKPTATSTPSPTPTPAGQALLAIFNDLNHELIMEIEGETWRIPANDTKVIERPPGTYEYTVTYAENGQLAAQGTRSWTVKAYKWRIGLDGDTFE